MNGLGLQLALNWPNVTITANVLWVVIALAVYELGHVIHTSLRGRMTGYMHHGPTVK